ncbi:hypothetical protein KL905_000686 [Ogataea polymorpha]|uniref:Peptide N-acetyl-beta-D-glucosaminyl asparaginase amidase A N-terminal domain-containing protein n=1 Tax=Ogataea polymorpha TaxID=460523 RepID=A0A9P8PS79_9ASCO|nr:hypothetical protein KL935_002035 [Ogataea polymorpha]KAG7910592.1 hypothetical protein KL907_001483 [Ogataea polymorpha]KAG7911110.1 hypothetical protein KL906_001490 [Ogataea polymorpha]KAG7918345.1 hypothetical protein KL927_001802 [Ogataea polymorpha]KAG7923468.1 hypothetical protein KL905_000686 [Ogataea polymorpha]
MGVMTKASLAREWAIWNQLIVHKKQKMRQQPIDDREPLLSEKNCAGQASTRPKSRTSFTVLKRTMWAVQVSTLILLLYLWGPPILQTVHNEVDEAICEVIEVGFPKPDFGDPVFEQNILNYTFGNSWGRPVEANYTKPEVPFNRVLVSLDTWVDGVQYDRLAHLYVSGIEVWRTSTIEPHGKLSHAHVEKDVSTYAKLFEEDATILFQLDNLLTPRLTGSFNISLNVKYYNVVDEMRRPADNCYPLVKRKIDSRPPLLTLPDNTFDAVIPQLSYNTTKVVLDLFVSGNAGEEFWFSNVLEEYKNVFHKSYPGHGPCRVINVFVDGIRVLTADPFVVVYTGGISPALWYPIVSTGAFDVRALRLDITPLLPIFWDQSTQVAIDVSNCVDDDLKIGEAPNGIGSNWIASGSVVTWEDSTILTSSGKILSFENKTSVSAFAFTPPAAGIYSQIVDAKYTNKVNSSVTYTYENGTKKDLILEVSSKTKQSNVQLLSGFGEDESLVFIPETDITSSVRDAATNATIWSLEKKVTQPLIYKLKEKPSFGQDVDFSVNITKAFGEKIALNGVNVIKGVSHENGTSNFTLSPKGNHGEAVIEHRVNFTMQEPLPELKYSRHVLADHGEIVYDTIDAEVLTWEDVMAQFENEGLELAQYAAQEISKDQATEQQYSAPQMRLLNRYLADF